jgi:hypothetical protein
MSKPRNKIPDIEQFANFSAPLIGLSVVEVRRGYRSALIIEFDKVDERSRAKKVQSKSNYLMSLMIEWSWRIEGRSSILCGSWSDERKWPRAFTRIRNAIVIDVVLFGRLAEIELTLSNGVRVLSFMTAEGNPAWTLFNRADNKSRWMAFAAGQFGSTLKRRRKFLCAIHSK